VLYLNSVIKIQELGKEHRSSPEGGCARLCKKIQLDFFVAPRVVGDPLSKISFMLPAVVNNVVVISTMLDTFAGYLSSLILAA